MSKFANNSISRGQFILMVHGAQVGIGLMSLPADLIKTANTDGWISLLIGWAMAVAVSLVIIRVMSRHPEKTLYTLLLDYFGAWLGGFLIVCCSLYFLLGFVTSFFASVFVMKIEILPKTPSFLLALLFAIPIYTIARNQVRVLARYAELTFWGLLWLGLSYLYPLRDAEWLNILPVIKEGWMPILAGAKTTILSFIGFETAFILYPYLANKRKAALCIVVSNTLTLSVYLIVCLVCFLFFSPDDLPLYSFPTLKAVKIIEFRFLERFEIIFLISYVYILSRVWIYYLYCGLTGTTELLRSQNHRPHLYVALVLLLAAAVFYAPTFHNTELIKGLFGQSGVIFAFALPLFLWGYTGLLGRFRKGRLG